MSDQSKKIINDILEIKMDWKKICSDHSLLEKGEFLNKVHAHILMLDKHNEHFKKEKTLYSLIFHILHTPIGAPNVTKDTLYDLAYHFSSKDPQNSSLHLFFKKTLNSSNENDNYLFNCLSIMEEKLKNVA